MSQLEIINIAADKLTAFISEFTSKAGFSRLVLGLSGGVDSSVSAVLGARALGPENVLGIIMPYKSSSPQSEQDALDLANKIGIKTEKIEISPMIDTYFKNLDAAPLRKGNKCARERMSILFDIAARDNCLVLGTSNKTEICLGYSTWYGDAACSLNPLGGLYKREVWALAEYLGVPRQIIEKSPTADLWPNQTDEDELGLTYKMADDILELIIEQGVTSLERILETGASEEIVRLVEKRINSFYFKRELPATELLDSRPIPSSVKIV
ncbi:MAG: NAD+ synthase [candidate division Zixibacteria bacterium]|nr:NAD+ synthase [candidate division Zixibacteria bacterium]